MTTEIATPGRLAADPTTRKSLKGTDVTAAQMAVSLPCHGAEQQGTMWVYLIAFGKTGEALAKHKKATLYMCTGVCK